MRGGGCLCGDVRYTVRGEPDHVGRCHCADCRKESGGVFTIYGQWPLEAFALEGAMATYHGRGFCARCGFPIGEIQTSGGLFGVKSSRTFWSLEFFSFVSTSSNCFTIPS